MARFNRFDEDYFLNFTNTGGGCYVTQLGKALPNSRYVHHKRALARHLFDYIVSGSGWVEYDGRRYEVKAGDLVYLKKGIRVDYGANPDDPYEKLWLAADGVMTDTLTETYLGGRELLIRHAQSDELLLKMKNTLAVHGHDEQRILHIMLDLIMTLQMPPAGKLGSEECDRLPERIRQYMEDHVTGRLSLDEMAAHFHISKRHLIRIFKASYHETPGAYHSGMRLQAAARYLAETPYPISEIAQVLGYSDQSCFSTAFKHRFGKSPQSYRAENS